MRTLLSIALAAALLALSAPAAAQLGFPTTAEDYPYFYVTAYYDHGGVTDWNCGSNSYDGHRGTDFGGGSWDGMAAGRDIAAAADGVVDDAVDGYCDGLTTSGCDATAAGYGNYVRIAQYDGLYAVYGHMMFGSVAVAAGDPVACGGLLGSMGSSGNSTGPHLHFEINSADWSERYDPFAGDCSDTGASMWAGQGGYDDGLGESYPLPALGCVDLDCAPVDLITCGAAIAASNDAPGSTMRRGFYGCTEFAYTGPEIAYAFVTDLDETVTVTLTGLSADLDLYALAGAACDGADCLAASSEGDASDESLAFDAVAGEEVVLVVDGFEGAVSGFTLTVACAGDLPDPEPDAGADGGGDADADADADAGSDSDADSDADSDSDADDDPGGSADDGCGCSAAGHGTHGLLAAILS